MSLPLEIVVTGDVSQAQAGLKAIQGDLGKTVSSTKNAGDAFDQMSKQMANFQRAANNTLNPQLIQVYNGKVQELQASMKALAAQADAEALSTENATANMAKMSIVSDATAAGQARLSSAIQRSTNPYQIAAREVNNFSRRLLYMAGAGVMELAIGVFQEILPYIQEFITGIDKSSDAAKLAAANLSNLNDVMADANKKAGEQIADLKILYQTATDVNLSMKDRLEAVRSLQKEFPDYFGNLTKEAILNGDAKKSYDELTLSIIKNAQATAAKSKIEALQGQILDAQFEKQKINNAAINELGRTKTKVSTSVGTLLDAGNGANVVSTKASQDAIIKGRRDEALALQDANIKILQDQSDFLVKFASLPSLAKVIEDGDKKDKKAKKGPDPFEVSLKDLEDNYKQAQALLVKQYDANLTNTKSNTTAVNDLILKAQLDFEEKKLALIKQYGKKQGDTNLEIAKTNNAILNNQSAFTIDQINTLPKVQTASKLNTKGSLAKIDPKPIILLSDAIKKNILLQQQMNELLSDTALILNKTVGPAFTDLFENILEGSGNAFKSFTNAIKQMLVQLGAAILKAALFSAILSVISGGVTNVGGGKSFMDEFTPALKGIFKFANGGPVKGFASGGISGPGTSTSDSIPAMLSNGEYVMNAASVSKFGQNFFDSLNSGMLPGFSKGGPVSSNLVVATNSTYIPDVTLRGQDLIIAFNRANQRASRNG